LHNIFFSAIARGIRRSEGKSEKMKKVLPELSYPAHPEEVL